MAYRCAVRFVAMLSVLTLFFSGGCGPKGPDTCAVSIKITHKGAPLEGAIVSIVSTDGQGNSASGLTDGSGIAKLHTTDGWDGAMAGEYAVTVTKWETITIPEPTEESPDGTRVEQKDILPVKYKDPAQSGFTISVSKKTAMPTFDIPE